MAENQRLFIAAFPPPALRRALHRLAREQHGKLGGRCMPAANLHLTLTFLGDTPVETVPVILELLETLPLPACTLSLDTLGAFHGGIVWAGCEAVPPTLTDWVAELRAGLGLRKIAFDNQAFFAHVTLLRKAQPASAAIVPALEWRINHARLYVSRATGLDPTYNNITY